ncbi:MAG: hypothetical protein SFW36_18790, partial [Leptolyngbyaceae cyanobacterium bins.59]|nr:hypothetical protein [Leptolyngbyaceae cyanobacterium bins.59]
MAQEFHLSVTPLQPGDYLVRTERVASGVPLAEERVIWPIQDWLHQFREIQKGKIASKESFSQRQSRLGQQLYDALFSGTLRDSWLTAQGISQHHREPLRLRLGLPEGELTALPWEWLTAAHSPIATSPDIWLSRSVDSAVPLSSGRKNAWKEPDRLTILWILAISQRDLSLVLNQQIARLSTALQQIDNFPEMGFPSLDRLPEETPSPIESLILEEPDRQTLLQTLAERSFHSLYYLSDQDFGQEGHPTDLLLEALAQPIVNSGVRLSVISSKANSRLSKTWVAKGMPAVLKLPTIEKPEESLDLASLFYRRMQLGYPVDFSLQWARKVSDCKSDAIILYMQKSFDGFLMPAKPEVLAPERSEEPEERYEQDETDFLSDLDYGEDGSEDYEEDSAVVADLFRQVIQSPPTESPVSEELPPPSAAP